jgi:Tol biopolymer transport system component
MTPTERYEFGDVTVDLRRVEVRRAGELVPLEPKSFDVLRHLVENRDRLVTKEELIETVWKATPAISPDGRSVAWVSPRTGKPEIYVSSLAPGRREFAVTSDGSGAMEPAFSPDGLWLAFRSLERKGIWIVPSTGGVARQVADFGSNPAWSPDSRSIVFTDVGGLSSQALLFVVPFDGAESKPLTRLGSPPGGHLGPDWSHDGRWIAFRVNRHQANEVWIVAAQGGGAPRRLATLDRFAEPRFAPDDRALYWFGRTADQNDCLVRLRLDAEARPVGGPETVLAFQGETVERLSIARDGTAVFLWNRLSANLWAIDVDARLEAGPPRPLTTDDEVLNRFAEYSTDGRIVFEQHGAGRPATAWVMDDDGGNRESLSPGAAVGIRDPQWDPEGRRVFAQAEPGKGEPRYFAWIDLPSRRLTRIDIPSPGGAARASLSPDGRHVAYHLVADDGVVNVWVQPLDGGPARQVTFDRPGQAGSDSPTSIRVKRPSAAHCANQRRSVSGVGASRCRRARDTALPRGRPSNRSERRRKASRLSSLR